MAARKERATTKNGPNYATKAYEPYALAIGQVALAFNHLHEMLGVLFGAVMQTSVSGIGQSFLVWHSSQFDRPKRHMLKAALGGMSATAQARLPTFRDEVVWLLHQVDELEEVRNNTIHSPLLLFTPDLERDGAEPHWGRVMPDALLGNPRAKKLIGKSDLLNEFRWCRDTARALSIYSVHMGFSLFDPSQPWPKRPRLPNRGQRKSRRGQRPRLAAK